MHLNLSGHVWPVASALDGTGLELGVPNLAAHKRPQEAQATLQTTQSSLARRGTQGHHRLTTYDGHPHKSWDLGILVYSESHSRKWQHCFLSIRESVANAERVTRDIELVSWTFVNPNCQKDPTRQGRSGSRRTDEPRWAVCSGGEGSPRTQWCKSRTCLPSF